MPAKAAVVSRPVSGRDRVRNSSMPTSELPSSSAAPKRRLRWQVSWLAARAVLFPFPAFPPVAMEQLPRRNTVAGSAGLRAPDWVGPSHSLFDPVAFGHGGNQQQCDLYRTNSPAVNPDCDIGDDRTAHFTLRMPPPAGHPRRHASRSPPASSSSAASTVAAIQAAGPASTPSRQQAGPVFVGAEQAVQVAAANPAIGRGGAVRPAVDGSPAGRNPARRSPEMDFVAFERQPVGGLRGDCCARSFRLRSPSRHRAGRARRFRAPSPRCRRDRGHAARASGSRRRGRHVAAARRHGRA